MPKETGLADLPSEVIEHILSQLLPEDLIFLASGLREKQEISYQDPNLPVIKKLRLSGDKAILHKLKSDPLLMQRLWQKKYQQHFPHSYQHINSIIHADVQTYTKADIDWQGMFWSQYNKLIFVEWSDRQYLPKELIPLTLRLLSAIKESNLDEVTKYFSDAISQTGLCALELLDSFKDLSQFTLLDWAIMKWVDTPAGNTAEKEAARAVLDYLYNTIDAVLILPKRLKTVMPSYMEKTSRPLSYRSKLDWAILCCQPSQVINPLLPSAPNDEQFESLLAAIRANQLPLMGRLLNDYLVKVHALTNYKVYYLYEELYDLCSLAIRRGYHDILDVLYQTISTLPYKSGKRRLVKALFPQKVEDISANKMRVPLLSLAIQYGYIDCARFLLERKVNVNILNYRGYMYPIHEAVFNNDKNMISLLLSYGAILDKGVFARRFPLNEICHLVQNDNAWDLQPISYSLLPDDSFKNYYKENKSYYLPSPLLREHRLSLVTLLVKNQAPLEDRGGESYMYNLVLLEADIREQLNVSTSGLTNLSVFSPSLTSNLLIQQKKMIGLLLSLDLKTIPADDFREKLLAYQKVFMADNDIAKRIRMIVVGKEDRVELIDCLAPPSEEENNFK